MFGSKIFGVEFSGVEFSGVSFLCALKAALKKLYIYYYIYTQLYMCIN